MKPEYGTSLDRRAIYKGLDNKVWLENSLLRTWSVADPELIGDLLRAPDMALPGLDQMITHIERRTGTKLSNLRRATTLIPIMHSGETHAQLRRALAVYLAEKVSVAPTVLPQIIDHNLKPLQIPGLVDIYHDVTAPLVREFISFLVGKPVTVEVLALRMDVVLNHTKSPSLIIELEQRFAQAFLFLEPDCKDEADLACKMCCILFGSETLLMMLIESILHAASNAGQGPVTLPDFPPETGAPLTWRYVAKDVDIGGCPVHAGDTIKLRLQAAGYSDKPTVNNLIFGAGLHSCIGKQISMLMWEHFGRAFNALQLHAKAGKYDAFINPEMIRYHKVELEIR
jgi:hypothetical protein